MLKRYFMPESSVQTCRIHELDTLSHPRGQHRWKTRKNQHADGQHDPTLGCPVRNIQESIALQRQLWDMTRLKVAQQRQATSRRRPQ